MLGLYLLGQNCLHLTYEQYLSSKTYSRKYEKLPNILACKILQKKMHLLKMSGPQIWLCLFTFRPIASKQLNGLTTIDTSVNLSTARPKWRFDGPALSGRLLYSLVNHAYANRYHHQLVR